MKRLCFIVPYFGKFPNYFPLFLKTCGTNPHFNWLVFTDDKEDYGYPDNVRRILMSFEECKALVKSKFDCDVNLNMPYKLCDLKPMYGYIFESYLSDYKFWGHCDVDTVMGNLEHWLTDEFLDQYDKLFCLGHMTIYRNTHENNRLFMTTYKGCEVYKEVLATPSIYTFDEEWKDNSNICRIFESVGKRIYRKDLSFNVACAYNRFRRIEFVGSDRVNDINGYKFEEYKESLYVWNNGNLYRLYVEDETLKKEDFLYMHFQNRKMKMDCTILQECKFEIIPDEFRYWKYSEVTINNFNQIPKPCKSHLQLQMFLKRIKRKFTKR